MKAFLHRLRTFAAEMRTRLAQSRIPGRYAFLIFGITAAFFVHLYNSYGLASGAEEGGTRLLQSFLAPWVPHKGGPRDAITVVVYDQASFDALKIDVPVLPYDRQAQLLDRVAAMNPAAIFIDANYKRDLSDPEGLKAFLSTVTRLRAAGTHVYIGEVKPARPATSTDTFFNDTSQSPFDRLRAAAKDKTTGFETGTLRNIDRSLDYPAETARLLAAAGDTTLIQTPAFRLYDDLCDPHRASSENSISRAELRCEGLPSPRPPLAIQWLSYDAARGPTSAAMGDGDNPACRRSAFATLAADVAHNVFRKPAREAGYVYNPCVYLRTVKLDTVLDAADLDAIRPNFQGKVVMIGSNLGDDSFVAPGQGKVPGVFLHAMALENLLAYGNAYHRWPPELPVLGGSINVDFFLELALALLANVAARNVERRFAEKEVPEGAASERSQLRVYFVTALCLSLLFGTVAMLVTYFVLHWTPVNALSITLAALTVAGLEKYHELLVVAKTWSPAGILAVLITGALVAWLVLSLFITNDVADPYRADHGMIWASGLVLAAWTAVLIYAYRAACIAVLRAIPAIFKYAGWR